jgi:hypothetical protein
VTRIPRVHQAIASAAATAILAVTSASCTGTTGYDLVSYYAAAVGPTDAHAGQPYAFVNDRGYQITLDRAVMHVGALYLGDVVPTSGQQSEPCTFPGTYVGEVRSGRDIDMLSPDLQLFPVAGDGSTVHAASGQVWLTHGDAFAATDPLPVLTLEGTATRDDISPLHFQAGITIDQDRYPSPAGTALPGAHPICQDRIVTPIPVDLALAQSGTLVLHLDPGALFVNVDFAAFTACSSCAVTGADGTTTYSFTNDTSNQPSVNLYKNLTAAGAVYRFEWRGP